MTNFLELSDSWISQMEESTFLIKKIDLTTYSLTQEHNTSNPNK